MAILALKHSNDISSFNRENFKMHQFKIYLVHFSIMVLLGIIKNLCRLISRLPTYNTYIIFHVTFATLTVPLSTAFPSLNYCKLNLIIDNYEKKTYTLPELF